MQTIFIPYEDAQFLASDLKGIFPIADYVFPEYNDFDWTGLNVFGSQATLELMTCLREKSGTDEENRFILDLLTWLEEGMEEGSDLMIEGTL